jgi:hypothetical protein
MRIDFVTVEGVHDIAFVQRILNVFGFEQKRLLGEIPPALSRLVPRSFPVNPQKDLTRRVELPHFHAREDHWIVVFGAGGDSLVVEALATGLYTLRDANTEPSSIGLVLDADNAEPAEQLRSRCAEWTEKSEDNELLRLYPFPPCLGISTTGKCPFGVFVMPDNVNRGSLENILLRQAADVYPVLYGKAASFIQNIKASDGAIPSGSELTREGRHEGKAVLHAMTSVLKPGKTLQASISSRAHHWVPDHSEQFPASFCALVGFLRELLQI